MQQQQQEQEQQNNNINGSMGMGEVVPLSRVDSALVLPNPGV